MATVNGTIVKASMESAGKMMESGFFEEEGMGNMEHLNGLLTKYIKMVQALEEQQDGNTTMPSRNTTINVNIDRSKLIMVGSKYEKEVVAWKNKCAAADEEIAALLAKIAQLEAEIKMLIKRNSDKDSAIWDRDLTIEKLRAEISRLQANLSLAQHQKQIFESQLKGLRVEIAKMTADLKSVVADYTSEKKNSNVLAARLRALEKDLRFKISILGAELETESSSANVDLSTIDTQIKDRYQIKMAGQLQMLRKMYEQHTEACTESLKTLYKKKVTDLEKEIGQLPKAVEQDGEFQELQVQLESCRLKSTELEANNLDLVSKHTALEAAVGERKRFFNDQLSAKERELKMLQQENEEVKKKYEKLMKELDMKQVRKYSNLLTPEISRISSRFGTATYVNTGKTLNFSHLDESSVVIKEIDTSSESETDGGKAKITMKSVSPKAAPPAAVGKIEAVKVEAKKAEATKVEATKVEASKVEATKVEATKFEATKVEASKVEASKVVIKESTQVTQSSSVTSQQVTNTKKATKGSGKKN